MRKKLNNMIALSAIAGTMLTAMPVTAEADCCFTDTFCTGIEVSNIVLEDIAEVKVEQREADVPTLDVSVNLKRGYSHDELLGLTGNTDSDSFCFGCSSNYGVIWNPEECQVIFYCDELDEYGEKKIRSTENNDYHGSELTGNKRTAWQFNSYELEAGDGFGFMISMLDGTESTDVKIFGHTYTITDQTADMMQEAPKYAPNVPLTEENISSEIKETLPVFSNLNCGTDIAEKMQETETQVTETQVTSCETQAVTTVTETIQTTTENPSTVSETVLTEIQSETILTQPEAEQVRTETETAVVSEVPATEQEWKVVIIPSETKETETEKENRETEKTDFPFFLNLQEVHSLSCLGLLQKLNFSKEIFL